MKRLLACATLLSIATFSSVSAQEAAGEAPVGEIQQLKEAISEQTKQLQSLTEEVGRLTRAVEAQRSSGAPAAPASSGVSGAGAPPASPEATPPPPQPAPAPEVRRAEAASSSAKHVVAKGETLTSIAKHYNITVPELQKFNKIEDDRKLQIGQTLTIPNKAPEPQPEKKENP
jgi:LysM repeat protein